MYYRIIKRLIALGRTDGLKEKINILWLDGGLTDEQRTELLGLLPAETTAGT